jgi:hypothetical protein
MTNVIFLLKKRTHNKLKFKKPFPNNIHLHNQTYWVKAHNEGAILGTFMTCM